MKTEAKAAPVIVTILNGEPPTLEEAKKLIGGGHVTMLTLGDGSQMLMDEEGLLKNQPLNRTASIMAGREIVGEVVVLQGSARWLEA